VGRRGAYIAVVLLEEEKITKRADMSEGMNDGVDVVVVLDVVEAHDSRIVDRTIERMGREGDAVQLRHEFARVARMQHELHTNRWRE